MDLMTRLIAERQGKLHGGIYDITQKRFAYNSNKIEGSLLTEEQTSFIFETKTIANIGSDGIPLDDFIESANHFKCFDRILDTWEEPLSENYIKDLHRLLKGGTSSETNPLTPVGHYKVVDNEVGRIATIFVEHTEEAMMSLLIGYQMTKNITLGRLASFHANFELIHPFADGNGRIGRLLLFKECLKHGLTPLIIDDTRKYDYYKALETAQLTDDIALLTTFFQKEQTFYANYLRSKGFNGFINDRKPIDHIIKKNPLQEKLTRFSCDTKKMSPTHHKQS